MCTHLPGNGRVQKASELLNVCMGRILHLEALLLRHTNYAIFLLFIFNTPHEASSNPCPTSA